MSDEIIEVDEELRVWFQEIREGVLIGLEMALHECLPECRHAIVSFFDEHKIFVILEKHSRSIPSKNFGGAPPTSNRRHINVYKVGFCIDLAIAAFEEGLKVHQENCLLCDDTGTG